jgi:hypothetical protein
MDKAHIIGRGATLATVIAVSYGIGRSGQKIRNWVDDRLASIDTAFASMTLDEMERRVTPEPCVCGSTEHQARRTAYTVTDGLLHNGTYGYLPVAVGFQYRDDDSLAVTMGVTLHVEAQGRVLGHDYQEWTFARDLIDSALSVTDERIVGVGDISVQYHASTDEVWIWLTHADGSKHPLEVPAGPVRRPVLRLLHVRRPRGAARRLPDPARGHLGRAKGRVSPSDCASESTQVDGPLRRAAPSPAQRRARQAAQPRPRSARSCTTPCTPWSATATSTWRSRPSSTTGTRSTSS